MDERQGQRAGLVGVAATLIILASAAAEATGPHRHFDLEAGDASLMLNEFSRQSDLQVLFDFNILKGVNTRAVEGDMDASAALKKMLKGTQLVFDFVNDHTLAVTPKKPSIWHRIAGGGKKSGKGNSKGDDQPSEIVVSGLSSYQVNHPGAVLIILGATDMDRSGALTVGDFLKTIPQVFGGGPAPANYVGTEAGQNASRGRGFNLRGMDAGSVVVLVNGKRLAPSGTAGAYEDVANIPLSAIDHIEILADGPSIQFGADAVSGIVNFVTKQKLEGVNTTASLGGAAGGLEQTRLSASLGSNWSTGRVSLALEDYKSDALPDSERAQATSNFTAWGAPNYDTPYGFPATILVGGVTYAIPKVVAGQSVLVSTLLPGTQNLYNVWNGDLYPAQRLDSIVGHIEQSVGDGGDVSFDGMYSRRSISLVSAPFTTSFPISPDNPYYLNPTGGRGTVTVLYGFGQDLGPMVTSGAVDVGTMSLDASMPLGDWSFSASVGYAVEGLNDSESNAVNYPALIVAVDDTNPATAFDPFGGRTSAATLQQLRTSLLYHSVSELKSASTRMSRSIATGSGGDVVLNLGAEFREQSLSTQQSAALSQSLQRNLRAAFGEIVVPVVGQDNRAFLLNLLKFSGGVRFEDYGANLHALSPKFGATWAPIAGLSFHGSIGRSFRPPNLADDSANQSSSLIASLPDKTSPTGTTTALVVAGSNPDLAAEQATNESIGVEINPVEGLSFSVNWFAINSTGRAVRPLVTPYALNDVTFEGVVIRNPTAVQLANFCRGTQFYGDITTCETSSVDAIVDGRIQSVQRLSTDGFDLLGEYSFNNTAGKWSIGFNGTYLLSYNLALPHQATQDLLGTPENPVDFRARCSFSWERSGMSFSAFANFTDAYHDVGEPPRRIGSLITFDAQAGYRWHPGDRWLKEVRIDASAQNLLNRQPPFVADPTPEAYDPANATDIGRFLSVRVSGSF